MPRAASYWPSESFLPGFMFRNPIVPGFYASAKPEHPPARFEWAEYTPQPPKTHTPVIVHEQAAGATI